MVSGKYIHTYMLRCGYGKMSNGKRLLFSEHVAINIIHRIRNYYTPPLTFRNAIDKVKQTGLAWCFPFKFSLKRYTFSRYNNEVRSRVIDIGVYFETFCACIKSGHFSNNTTTYHMQQVHYLAVFFKKRKSYHAVWKGMYILNSILFTRFGYLAYWDIVI